MGAKPSRAGYHVIREVTRARGHEHVCVEHTSTFEVTTDDWLIPADDYIIGVEAERTLADFDPAFVEAYQSRDATIDVRVRVDIGDETRKQTVHARGHPDLAFEDDRNIVLRTSDYMDDRVGAVDAVHAMTDFDRDLVSALADGAELIVTIKVE